MTKLLTVLITTAALASCAYAPQRVYTYDADSKTHTVSLPSEDVEAALDRDAGALRELDIAGKAYYAENGRRYRVEFRAVRDGKDVVAE